MMNLVQFHHFQSSILKSQKLWKWKVFITYLLVKQDLNWCKDFNNLFGFYLVWIFIYFAAEILMLCCFCLKMLLISSGTCYIIYRYASISNLSLFFFFLVISLRSKIFKFFYTFYTTFLGKGLRTFNCIGRKKRKEDWDIEEPKGMLYNEGDDAEP